MQVIFCHPYKFQQFRLSVNDSRKTTAIWTHHLTREEGFTKKGKPKYRWLSYGIRNGKTQTKINHETVSWNKLLPNERAAIREKLEPLKWLLQK